MTAYKHKKFDQHHGIVSYTGMLNGDIYFTTSEGTLFRLNYDPSGAEKLKSLGLFNPEGEAYTAGLFSIDGKQFMVGLSKCESLDTYELLVRENQSGVTANYPLKQFKQHDYLFYGSATQDEFGNIYVVGVDVKNRSNHHPRVFKIQY
jgi:hypothetical protein